MPNNKLSNNVYLEKIRFTTSVECDTTNRLYPINVHDDKDCSVCLFIFSVYLLIYEGSTLKY
jgi:hypothetical protein